jgi:hypothetical protein
MIVVIHEPTKYYDVAFPDLVAQSRTDWLCVIPLIGSQQEPPIDPSIAEHFRFIELLDKDSYTFKEIVRAAMHIVPDTVDLFTFKNSLDVWAPNYLKSMVRSLESHRELLPAVHGAICHSTIIYSDGHKTHEGFISEGLLDLTELYMEKQLCSSQVLLDREGITHGTEDTVDGHEVGDEFWDFLLRCTKDSEFAIVPQYLVTQQPSKDEEAGVNRQLIQRIFRQHALNDRIRNWDYSVIFGALYTAVDRLENVLLSQSQEIQRLTQLINRTHQE